jgi:hypothetical protein
VQTIRDQFSRDAKDGTLPYEAVRKLRTRIGEKLANPSLLSS